MVIVPIVYVLTNDFPIRCQSATSDRRNSAIYRIGLLVWLLFYIESPSTCWCKGALLLDENFVFRKTPSSSSAALPSRSDDTFTGGDIAGQLTKHEIAASQANILNMAAATIASGDVGDSLYIVRNNGGDTFIDSGKLLIVTTK